MALNISERIVAVGLPFPMSVGTGNWFCKWSALPGNYLNSNLTASKHERMKSLK